jgi:hypothetical protein
MPAFSVGQTHVTAVPWVDVDGLQAGTYRFRLEVEDAAGLLSMPSEITVVVTAPPPPPPPVTPPPVTRPPINKIPVEPIVRAPTTPIIKTPLEPIERVSIPSRKLPGGGFAP